MAPWVLCRRCLGGSTVAVAALGRGSSGAWGFGWFDEERPFKPRRGAACRPVSQDRRRRREVASRFVCGERCAAQVQEVHVFAELSASNALIWGLNLCLLCVQPKHSRAEPGLAASGSGTGGMPSVCLVYPEQSAENKHISRSQLLS